MGAKKWLTKASLTNYWLFGLSIIAGLALSIPFWSYSLGWLVLVALLPFIALLTRLESLKLSRRSSMGYIWMSGLVFLLSTTHWVLQTQPDRWAGLTGWWSIGSMVVIYLIFSLVLSLGFVIFGLGWVYLKPRLYQKRIFLVMPALWVMGEWLRSWAVSLIGWGPNTTIGMHWNFGDLGFAASVTPLVFLARLGGLYGLAFVVVIINLCIFWLIQRRWKLPVIILLLIALGAIIGWWAYKTPTGRPVNVAALQLSTNQDLQIGSIDYHQKLSELKPANRADILVLSEYSSIFEGDTKQADSSGIKQLVANSNVPIITSRTRNSEDKQYNAVTVYNSAGEIVYEHDKQFLILVGEAMPSIVGTSIRALGQGGALKIREISRGVKPAEVYTSNGIKLGIQACSGAISPESYRELVRGGAQILTNSASLSIFAGASYHSQAGQMARFMAVSNARPFVQATDGSYSFVIDSNGQLLARSNQKDMQLLSVMVTTNSRRTIYTLLGEWVVWLSTVILIVQGIYLLKLNRKR